MPEKHTTSQELAVAPAVSDVAIRRRRCIHLGWDRHAHLALAALNVQTWGDLADLSASTLLLMPRFGRAQLATVQQKLASVGLTLTGARSIGARNAASAFDQVRDRPPVGGVYFLRCEQFVKIGHAADIRERLIDLATITPFDVEIVAYIAQPPGPHARALEKSLHARFSALRHRAEWFRLEEPLIGFIQEVNDGN
ncbi:MAG TPA: GIY-YIG nuclease family protein [Thermoanaerobaculia bacterium]|nr:GIY-YIG nuclease family protein [Thermoanaerobaculia bacterium]